MGKVITVTKHCSYEITISYQAEEDPYDGSGPGYYAWVGAPGQQSDFCVGPYKTAKLAEQAAEKRL